MKLYHKIRFPMQSLTVILYHAVDVAKDVSTQYQIHKLSPILVLLFACEYRINYITHNRMKIINLKNLTTIPSLFSKLLKYNSVRIL